MYKSRNAKKEMTSNKKRHIKGISAGLVFLLLCHILVGLVVIGVSNKISGSGGWLMYHVWLWRIWFWQLFYAIPAIIYAYARHHYKAVTGIATGVVITSIINFAVGHYLGWLMWFSS